ncbi:C40 family peptidase [Desulfitibacter alkalitolerans]|jgi:cell wall-associated NlpC family hydrolase|uniref:C40 family peptidase n=1 Tax=Desulfitibacter alkalitolerans TaxID=264641 RepID=UPI0005567B21|nr:NlpC/P60 family protein [Desulfitibacter alkalitolerans]
MALDPATVKAILLAAEKVATDRNVRNIVIGAVLVPFIIILLILASPFAIFFAITGGGAGVESLPISTVMQNLKYEFSQRIEAEQIPEDGIDDIQLIIMGSEDGTIIDNSGEVLALFAVEANTDNENGEQVAMLNKKQISRLKDIYRDMNRITVEIEEIEKEIVTETAGENGKTKTESTTVTRKIKKVYVDSLTCEEVVDGFNFNEIQLKLLAEIRSSEYAMLMSGATGRTGNTVLTQEEISKIRAMLPADLDLQRKKVVMAAYSIVGRVNYFWGGKSHVIGWDSRWGEMSEVTSPGSSSTGTSRPFGLDCSGYVTWVFINAGVPVENINDTVGHGVTRQWELSIPISEQQVLSGDIAVFYIPGTRKVNHVGIVVSIEEGDKIMVAHCASGSNNVDVTEAKATGFRYFRRPVVLTQEITIKH